VAIRLSVTATWEGFRGAVVHSRIPPANRMPPVMNATVDTVALLLESFHDA
jgi:hypothetical protein